MRTSLGIAPHSGWASVVGLGESDGPLRVVLRERIELFDPRMPESKQPYHALEGLDLAEAARRLGVFEATAARLAQSELEGLLGRLGERGGRVIGIGILDASGRGLGPLEQILASHAMIHTADGAHYRNALAAAAARCGLAATRVRARELEAQAATVSGESPEAMRQSVAALGRKLGPPWGADQKAAALLAWLLLAREPGAGRRRGGGV